MLVEGGTIDEDIVKEYKYELAKVRLEYTVHEGLKDGWGIGESKRHY